MRDLQGLSLRRELLPFVNTVLKSKTTVKLLHSHMQNSMGQGCSDLLKSEFDKRALVDSDGLAKLTLSRLSEFPLPFDIRLNLCHIPILWKADDDKDGFFILADLEHFCEFYLSNVSNFLPLEVGTRVSALCALDMSRSIQVNSSAFVDWLPLLIRNEVEHNSLVSPQPQSALFVDKLSKSNKPGRSDLIETLFKLLADGGIIERGMQQEFFCLIDASEEVEKNSFRKDILENFLTHFAMHFSERVGVLDEAI